MEEGLLFRVFDHGKEYKIYIDGNIVGFDEGAIVFNYFDLLVAKAIQLHEHRRQKDAPHQYLEGKDGRDDGKERHCNS